MTRPARGLILQPTYRLQAGRPAVHLWGKLDSGEPFLLRDRRAVPHFYIAAADTERARELGARQIAATSRTTLDGVPAARVEVAAPSDAPPLRDRLSDSGVRCYEADVRFAYRYLIDHRLRGTVAIGGEGQWTEGLGWVFDDPPEVGPADPAGGWLPELSVLSFDIETDPSARRLLSIALAGCGAEEVLLWTPEGRACPAGAEPFATERDLIEAFCRRVRELDPDVITGWNVEDFDLAVLDRLARREGLPGLDLGRGSVAQEGGALRLRPSGRGSGVTAGIPGRLVLDGPKLLRGAFVRMDSYGLDAVAREVLGEGKTVTGEGLARAEEILRMFEDDRARLVEYNLQDARLAAAILAEMKLVELAVERSLLTGLPPDRVSGSIAAFDLLYLTELGRRGVVAPTVRLNTERAEAAGAEATGGGHVLDPAPGLWNHVLVLDFKSLYPSLIRTFNIDPFGLRRGPASSPGGGHTAGPLEKRSPIVAPNGAAFGRQPGILPRLLDELFPRREEAKAAGDTVKSYAIKILMNSFYGVLATPACRFYNPKVANAITSFGRELLLWTRERIEETYGLRVLYGDTDSLFVDSGAADTAEARDAGERLVRDLNRDLAEHVATGWQVESHLELEFERLYRRLFLPPVRGGETGARKRYAGLVEDEGGETRVVLTGMEAVRRDWTDLAHRVQRELYERLFHDRPVEDYLRTVVADLRAGRTDLRDLVYRKGLRKPPEAYTATTPPHVAAARKLPGRPPRVISYLMTTAGPEPLRRRDRIEPDHPPDYEHYVDKQIRPVAEPVLELLGLSFAKVIGDDRQMELF